MKLHMHISNIKSISDFSIDFPLDKGLYAITGTNGSGKSTIIMCAATSFFHVNMQNYLGKPDGKGSIEFRLENQHRKLEYDGHTWIPPQTPLNIKGFYEGSVIYGNRFRDTNFSSINKLESIKSTDLISADEFVRVNLGDILHDNPLYYEKLYCVSKYAQKRYKFRGQPYFYERKGIRVSQAHMSTGENLLVSVLHSLNLRVKNRQDLNLPCLMFLDEIELALHPSALRRLVSFLKDFAETYNMAIFFSTHSLELIRDIAPTNIFYIERHIDDEIELINPCYPAYATRSLYCSFDYDRIILVEDDLAKAIVDKLLKSERLLGNKLVYVLPSGGWQNVLKMACDISKSNLIPGHAKVIVVLDGDIREQSKNYLDKNHIIINIPINYLPLKSFEKYLKEVLYDKRDPILFRELNDYIFQRESLDSLVVKYNKEVTSKYDDNDGKRFFSYLELELKEIKKDRRELVEYVVDYILTHDQKRVDKISCFLKKQI